jgi:hypothetical protein
MSILTKAEAKSIISALDLKPIDQYVDCVQRDYTKIMAEEKKPKRGKRAEIKILDEVMDVEPVAIEPEPHEVVIEKENE